MKLKEEAFANLIKMFSSLRNVLMHNGCLIKFSFNLDEATKKEFEKYFNFSISSTNIKLNDVIFIMESIIDIKNKIFAEINESIENKFKNRIDKPDKVSKIIFDIIEQESSIKIKYDLIKDKLDYFN